MRREIKQNRSRLIGAAMGRVQCDLTVTNVQLFNVFTGEIYPAEVDILDGFVVQVRTEDQQAPMPAKETFDGEGNFLIPGYIDTHMHVESTLMIPENLSRAIMPWGTTTVCTDPHEIGNVMGVEGVKFMLENGKKSKLRQYVLAPSCVPAVPALEGAGAAFLAKEVGEMLDMDDVIGIAEIMDYVNVQKDDERMHTIVEEGIKRGMYLQGHAPTVVGAPLAGYRLGGPRSDHESASTREVMEKLRMGMYVNVRASSMGERVQMLVDGFKDHRFNDFVTVCTDDVHAKDLLWEGHINRVVKKMIGCGIDGRDAIKMATLNAAREYKFDDLGAIAPGYVADMQLVEALDGSRPLVVFAAGEIVAKEGKYVAGDKMEGQYSFANTVNAPQVSCAEDFYLKVPEGYDKDTITVNVIARTPGVFARYFIPTELPVVDGHVDISSREDLAFVVIANRYGSGSKSIGVYKDLGFGSGTYGTTVSHDSHNLTVVYRDVNDALEVANRLKAEGGGFCVKNEGELTCCPLPVAGLMSQDCCEVISEKVEKVQEVLAKISGGKLQSVLCLSVLALPVCPGVIMTDKGIVDGESQTFLSVFAQ